MHQVEHRLLITALDRLIAGDESSSDDGAHDDDFDEDDEDDL